MFWSSRKFCFFFNCSNREKIEKKLWEYKISCLVFWARNMCKIFSLIPSKKNYNHRRLRQTKCLLFDFWMIKLTVVKFRFSKKATKFETAAQWSKNYPQILSGFKHFYYKKAAVVSNFCLIGKIRHDFLVPTMIELGCKTFMPFQTSDLHRVNRPVKLLKLMSFIVWKMFRKLKFCHTGICSYCYGVPFHNLIIL